MSLAGGGLGMVGVARTRELGETGLRGWLWAADRLNLSRVMPA